MNRLQGVSDRENYFVSIGRPEAIDPARVLQRIETSHRSSASELSRRSAALPGLNASARGGTETYFLRELLPIRLPRGRSAERVHAQRTAAR
jgi:predicted NAD/FAD-binding protein